MPMIPEKRVVRGVGDVATGAVGAGRLRAVSGGGAGCWAPGCCATSLPMLRPAAPGMVHAPMIPTAISATANSQERKNGSFFTQPPVLPAPA